MFFVISTFEGDERITSANNPHGFLNDLDDHSAFFFSVGKTLHLTHYSRRGNVARASDNDTFTSGQTRGTAVVILDI